jgi:uncharacterized protein YwqG
MTLDISPLIEKYSRPTVDLVMRESTYSVSASHFGGKPFATADSEGWPVCAKCKYGMIFVCQIALTKEQQTQLEMDDALVQLFCCARCHDFGNMAPGTFEVWRIKANQLGEYKELEVQHNLKKSPIFKWLANVPYEVQEFSVEYGKSFVSMPDPFEVLALVKKAKEPALKSFAKQAESYAHNDDYEHAVIEKGMKVYDGAMKLGGYASWQQTEGLQICKQCKEPMDVFLQIDGEYCWIGTDGYAVLMHCKKDRDSFALVISGT